jgi:hypothetical protein
MTLRLIRFNVNNDNHSRLMARKKPVIATLVGAVLSCQLDDPEPTLTRHGYRLKDMVEQFDAKPAEIRALFNNQSDPARTAGLRDRMLAVGLPI